MFVGAFIHWLVLLATLDLMVDDIASPDDLSKDIALGFQQTQEGIALWLTRTRIVLGVLTVESKVATIKDFQESRLRRASVVAY